MQFFITPGNALLCTINGHRAGWNGTICADPVAWNCGAKKDFREENCDLGNPKCFHIHAFEARDCHMTIEDKGAGWVLAREPDAFDDQVLLVAGRPFHEPRGIREGVPADPILYGAYRVQRVDKREAGYAWTLWDVYPYADGWVRLEDLRLRAPFSRKMEGPYLQEVERNGVVRVFRDAVERAQSPGVVDVQPGRKERLHHFQSKLGEWLDIAAKRREASTPVPMPASPVRRSIAGSLATFGDVMSGIRLAPRPAQTAPVAAAPVATPPIPSVPPAPSVVAQSEPPAAGGFLRAPLVEETAAKLIERLYGTRALHSIRIASMTKTLMIFVGAPGVGKSRLAMNLIEDANRERTCIVAVSSTWRGPEDLVGYVNPITGEFEPTAFTSFLKNAEEAWRAGDHRARLVVFEEFNLSPPEYWLSEILVRSQYDAERRDDRTIVLGGKSVRGWGTNETPKVMISPAVHFVATVNSDHTTRQLSPRVLDRSALVELRMNPKAALDHAGVVLESEQLEAVEELDFCLQSVGAGFSLRTAMSLQGCQRMLDQLGLTLWEVLDIVLLQEILSKVRLLAGDAASQALLDNLHKWTDDHGKNLAGCTKVITEWEERLGEGRDVIQA